MPTPHAHQDSNPLRDEDIIPPGLHPFPGPFARLTLDDLVAGRQTLFGAAALRLDLGTWDGWRRVFGWERWMRATGDLRGVRWLVWWHRKILAGLFERPRWVPPKVLWLVLCHLRQSSAISGAIVRWLRSIIRPICVSLGSGLRVRRGDLPEDVEQEVLVYFEERVFQERRWPNDPEAYLSKVARRVVARLRRQSARVLDLVTGTDLAEVLAQAHTRSADIAAQINAAVLAEQFGSQLTSRQRAVFVLRWIGFSDTEIAKRLQLSRRRVCEIGKQIVRRLGPVWTASSL